MSKGFFARVAGAVRMGYYEFVDPVDDFEVEKDEHELQCLRLEATHAAEEYDRLLTDFDRLAMDFDAMEWDRDEWRRRYDDLLANVMAPIQEDEPLLLPADKLKPSGIGQVNCPSVWIEPTEVPRTQITTTGVYTPPNAQLKADINKWLEQPKKKAAKKPAKKSVKKAGK